MNVSVERAKFESNYTREGFAEDLRKNEAGGYLDYNVHLLWRGWQACAEANSGTSAPSLPNKLDQALERLGKVPAAWQAEFNTQVLCVLRLLVNEVKR